ncbi:MarR family transcriptional regulator [Novosphingobium barchaimii LL02]|uniref:MarR family transcriptional regulator n=1 Tax=Novosphingobium barchaimii LL02 TaxID=1114963 RepID=A0A0J7XXP7_9SPHN|nr:MarR family transcriptional regulator [Novosphingobium barchaimii]KMS56456.1 MarR family transcriptional regulator [Novosphingobium barchaimii LL02]
MPSRLTDADYQALAEFRFSLRQFQTFSEQKAEECGLTPQQHQALLVIRAAPAGTATIGYVAERLIVKPHSATGLVNRLVALDFVKRGRSDGDKRQAVLNLTEGGHQTLAALSATHQEEIRRLGPLLIGLLAKVQD